MLFSPREKLTKVSNFLASNPNGKTFEKHAHFSDLMKRNFSSTTSTLSAGSTGSQARLIQSSHQPENYQPIQVEDLGKQAPVTRTVRAEIHESTGSRPKSLSRSPNRTPNRSPSRSPNKRRDSTSPSRTRRPSPNKSRRSDSLSPRSSRRGESPKGRKDESGRSPRKIKSSLKQPSRSLSIENPTCVECYLSGKQDGQG